MPTDKCDFCNEFSGNAENTFYTTYKGCPETRFLFRSDRFVVVPSVGQLVEGYLLVLPVHHCKALGDLCVHALDELAILCVLVRKILGDHYGRHILFEHGTRSEGVGGCGIYHAHLHATPLAGTPDPIDALKARFRYTGLADLSELSKKSAGLPSYLFYQDSHGRLYLFDTGPLRSQYMRKLLADALGRQDWDWRTVGREERLLATLERLSGQLEIIDMSAPQH